MILSAYRDKSGSDPLVFLEIFFNCKAEKSFFLNNKYNLIGSLRWSDPMPYRCTQKPMAHQDLAGK
jgi:hypothetical protein